MPHPLFVAGKNNIVGVYFTVTAAIILCNKCKSNSSKCWRKAIDLVTGKPTVFFLRSILWQTKISANFGRKWHLCPQVGITIRLHTGSTFWIKLSRVCLMENWKWEIATRQSLILRGMLWHKLEIPTSMSGGLIIGCPAADGKLSAIWYDNLVVLIPHTPGECIMIIKNNRIRDGPWITRPI